MENTRKRIDSLSKNHILTPVLLALAAVCLGVLALWFAAADNRNVLFLSYFSHPLTLLLNILPALMLALVLYFLIGRADISFSITALVIMGFALANYFKLTFRNDPLYFADLFLIREAGNMVGRYQLFFSKSMLLALVLLVAAAVFLHFFARARTPWKPRLLCFLATLLACVPLWGLYTDPVIYITGTANNEHINIFSETQIYVSRGFWYPFLYSTRYAKDTPPADYDEKQTKAALSAYEDADIPADKKVDLIALQLEAYNDFTKFGAPALDPSVYESFHALEAESYTGNLVTNIFAGGTVDTERCFLTGLTGLPSFRGPTNSYAWYLQQQGYTTEGSHPSSSWFYNRQNINSNLGFQNYYFLENRYATMTGGGVGPDSLLFPDMKALYKAHKQSSDAPYFNFSVTYQGHGPYDTAKNYWSEDYLLENDYTQEQRNLLNNYFGSLKDTGDRLAELVDFFRSSEEPVVLVVFGDHNPWMGDNNSIYDLLGINLDVSTKDGFLNYYSTRYLIWANDAAKAALGHDFNGVGPDISPNYLMSEVFRLCGWDGPAYMQAIRPAMEQVPVINVPTGLYLENGALTGTLSGEHNALINNYKHLQYYWRKHFSY